MRLRAYLEQQRQMALLTQLGSGELLYGPAGLNAISGGGGIACLTPGADSQVGAGAEVQNGLVPPQPQLSLPVHTTSSGFTASCLPSMGAASCGGSSCLILAGELPNSPMATTAGTAQQQQQYLQQQQQLPLGPLGIPQRSRRPSAVSTASYAVAPTNPFASNYNPDVAALQQLAAAGGQVITPASWAAISSGGGAAHAAFAQHRQRRGSVASYMSLGGTSVGSTATTAMLIDPQQAAGEAATKCPASGSATPTSGFSSAVGAQPQLVLARGGGGAAALMCGAGPPTTLHARSRRASAASYFGAGGFCYPPSSSPAAPACPTANGTSALMMQPHWLAGGFGNGGNGGALASHRQRRASCNSTASAFSAAMTISEAVPEPLEEGPAAPGVLDDSSSIGGWFFVLQPSLSLALTEAPVQRCLRRSHWLDSSIISSRS